MSASTKWWARGAVLLVAGGILATASPALAATVWSPGSEARATSSGSSVTIYDEEANGESAYSHFYREDHPDRYRVEVTTGNGTSNTSYDYGDIDRFRACNNNNNFPDDCSDYVYI